MASPNALPEPMNSQPNHSKVKVTITLPDPTFVAGNHVCGKLEMECRADKGLGLGIMMIELFAVQELSSRDHSATSTFLHSRRLFQGPGLPPSNAVEAYPQPGDPPLPPDYHQARKGRSTFLFRIPLPVTSPPSLVFGTGLAKVRYELRASVGVFWKNERRLVVDKRAIDVVAALPYDVVPPEGIVVGESGKLWMQGKLVGANVVAGSPACVELQVKNHSARKNSGLTVSLTRTLYLPGATTTPLQLSDSLTVVPFRGPEYIIPPGAEGIANLVFDVPKQTRGVSGGLLDGEEAENGTGPRRTESLFEIRCKVEVKLTMGVGSKDIVLEIPVEVVHPLALPLPQETSGPYYTPQDAMQARPAPYPEYAPYYPPASPVHGIPYMDPVHNQVWFPPPPMPHQPVASYPYQSDAYSQPQAYPASPHAYFSPGQLSPSPGPFPAVPALPPILAPQLGVPMYIQRPSSAGPVFAASEIPAPMIPGLPVGLPQQSLLPLQPPLHELGPQHQAHEIGNFSATQHTHPEPESQEGKGERASRITHHLRMLSRNRSVSPQSHRYPLPVPPQPQNAQAFSNGHTLGVPLHPLQPPMASPVTPLAPRAKETAVLYSPRPQLTPKTSFTRDPVLGMTRSKSERVDELEKMADEVVRKSTDLSADLPKEAGELVAANQSPNLKKHAQDIANEQPNMNKTLPGPPVPSGKQLAALPARPRADLYFDGGASLVPETQPLPSDQTPPTPALVALPSRQKSQRDDLRTEGGLDALERRLLAEVGTRKVDTRHLGRDKRPDVRSVLPSINTSASATAPIAIPSKSPEPLDDSAISSLTLAGGLAGADDSDGEFDGKTHKAGGSRSGGGSSVGRGEGGLHQRMRARAQQVSTPTRTLAPEREKAREAGEGIFGEMDWSSNFANQAQETDQGRMASTAQLAGKKPKSGKAAAAKGRVAAWLGCIDPDVPPQEQIIPPSPSVLRHPETELGYDNDVPTTSTTQPVPPPDRDSKTPGPESRQTQPTEVDASPNPRSSGFVPISALKRLSIDAQPLLLSTVNTVVQEARRVQDLWSSATSLGNSNGEESEKNPVSGVPSPAPIPDSSKAGSKPSMPLSYSAAARNVRKNPESAKVAISAKTSAPPPPPPRDKVRAMFPPSSHKFVDPEIKYDIRSARGGRGGKVTQVANLWASGAINGNSGVKKDSEVRPSPAVVEKKLPPPPPREKMLFSAALKTPSPRRKQPAVPPPAIANGAPQVKSLDEAQKRPDSRALFQPPNVNASLVPPVPKRSGSSAALSTPAGGPVPPITKESFAAAHQRRPATSMSFNSRQPVPPVSNPPAMPVMKMTKAQFGLGAKASKPGVIKGTSDPAVVSSSHAVPMLSTTASLVRPHPATSATGAPVFPRPAMMPTTLSSSRPKLNVSSQPSEPPRPPSPNKPVDLAFGQARLRDLIKKYQGQGQKT